ncbi:heterocyst differentiation protein [Paenibacillus sp. JCM 10914]|nr:heterocyst differentiation protein [Paenibacillus sp. JCM 10914]
MESLLNRVTLFDVMNEQERALLSSRLVPEQYEMGQTIVWSGKPMEAFYIIAGGKARRIMERKDGTEKNLGLLQPGEHFGESGLLGKKISDMTIRASTELWLWKLSKEDFSELLLTQPKLEGYMNSYIAADAKLTFLQATPIGSHVEPSVLHSLLDQFTMHRYEAGVNVVTEGEAGDAFYILRSGKVEVISVISGETMKQLDEGDFFGDMAQLTGKVWGAAYRTTEEVTLFRLPKEAFDVLLRTYPAIQDEIVQIASTYQPGADTYVRGMLEMVDVEEPRAEHAPFHLVEKIMQEEELLTASTDYTDRVPKRRRLRKFPMVLQQSEMDCGPACLSMISRFYGTTIPINAIKSIARTSQSGTTLQQLLETAQWIGFEGQGIRTDLTDLSRGQLPAVAHWRGNHYVVVYEVTDQHVYIADPAIGLDKLTREQFASDWNGLLLLLNPTSNLKTMSSGGSTLQRYASFLKPHSRMLALILTLSVVIQVLSLSLPVFTQTVIDTVLVERNESLLLVLLLGMLAISMANTLFIFIRQWIVSQTALKIDMNMIHAFYKQVLRLPLSFFDNRTVGDMLARVNENEKIRSILTNSAAGLILDIITMIVYGSLMLYYNAKLFMIAAIIFPLYALVIYVISPRMRMNSRKQFLAQADSDSTMVEAVHHIASVKALTAEQKMFNQLQGKFKKAMDLRLKGIFLWVSAETAGEWIRTLGTIIVLFFGSRYVLQGEMSTGELVAFTVLLTTVTQSISFLIQMLDDLMEARISMERLDDVFEVAPEQTNEGTLRKLAKVKGHMLFKNVTFRYEEEGQNVLQNVQFEMRPGQSVALIGRSGSGKSTLANLMMKLYQPVNGMITLDGYDLRELDAGFLRRHIGWYSRKRPCFAEPSVIISGSDCRKLRKLISSRRRGWRGRMILSIRFRSGMRR